MKWFVIIAALIGVAIGFVLGLAQGGEPVAPSLSPPGTVGETSEEVAALEPKLALPREPVPEPAPGPDEIYLARVIEAVGKPEGYLPDYPPRSLGQHIAARQKQPLYSSRWEAIIALLPQADASRLLGCISGLMGAEQLADDYLTEVVDQAAVIWDPVGREYVERVLLFGTGSNEAGGRQHFRDRFLETFGVARLGGSTGIDFAKRSHWNPDKKSISPEALVNLRALEVGYAESISDLIYKGSIVSDYMDARAIKVAAGDYLALPFEFVSIFSKCGTDNDETLLGYSVAQTGAWTAAISIAPGDHPAYDNSLSTLRSIVAIRDAEIISMIATLP